MKYILRVITKEFLQPIDDVRDFIRRIVEDDKTSAVEFDDYIRYWKTENQGVILAKVSTLIPFNIIRNRIGAEWCAADKIALLICLIVYFALLWVIYIGSWNYPVKAMTIGFE